MSFNKVINNKIIDDKVIDDKILLQELIKRTDNIDEKLNKIISILNNDLQKNTQKMANHIDFIENIYNNVKSPLGFLCNKINYFKRNDNNNYSLDVITDKNEYLLKKNNNNELDDH